MALGVLLLVQAACLTLVSGFNVVQHPIFFNAPAHRPVYGYQEIRPRNEDYNLPCPGDAFFVHPRNCTRFYRCVDYVGSGALYARYFFECPKDHIFLTAAQTCLPGMCIGLVQPVVLPATPATPVTTPISSPAPPPADMPFENLPGDEPVTSDFWDSTTEESVTVFPGQGESGDSGSDGTGSSSGSGVSSTSVGGVCQYRYVQHPLYCNLYNPCNEPETRYVCPSGTAFDAPRQMCRIAAADDAVCTGKNIFTHPFLLRSENIGTHVRLPNSIVVPTSVRQTNIATPEQIRLWPTSKPNRPLSNNLDTWPAFRPFEQIPGQAQSAFRPFEQQPGQQQPAYIPFNQQGQQQPAYIPFNQQQGQQQPSYRPFEQQSGQQQPSYRPFEQQPVQQQQPAFKPFEQRFDQEQPNFRPIIQRPAQVYSRPDAFNQQEEEPYFSTGDNVVSPYNYPDENVQDSEPEYITGNPAFRPLIQRPAQVYAKPDESDSGFSLSFSRPTFSYNIFHKPATRNAQTPASTKPLAVVRRPLVGHHLHFPQFQPLNAFSGQAEVEVA